MAAKRLMYLYCVTKSKPSRRYFKELGVRIYLVYFEGTYAIVGKVSPNEFNEDGLKKRLTDSKWVEEKVRQHEKIVESVMQDTMVLPFKFATIFETKDKVMNLLKEHNAEFKKIISDLEGKQEWGLKIYCDLKKLKTALKEDERVQEVQKQIDSASKGKAYLLDKKKKELIDNILSERISEYTQDSFERLKRPSLEAKINKLLPKQLTQKDEEMVLNAAFLVNKDRINEFDSILEYLKGKYQDKGLSFEWTGPWPPYNFCPLENK